MATANPDYVIVEIGWTPAPPKHIQKIPCAICHGPWAVFGSIRCADHRGRCAACSGQVQTDSQLICADCYSLGKLLQTRRPALQTEAAWEAKALEEGASSNLSSPASPVSAHTIVGFTSG